MSIETILRNLLSSIFPSERKAGQLQPMIGLVKLKQGDLVEIVGESTWDQTPKPVALIGRYQGCEGWVANFNFIDSVEGRPQQFSIKISDEYCQIPQIGNFVYYIRTLGYRVMNSTNF
jgi:hypothetical protein